MNITSKGRYALRVMLDLAQHPGDGFVSLKVTAERQDISLKYLEMIISHLRHAGLVESTRGKEGGYRLTRAPEDYTVLQILESIEDSLAPVSCIQAGEIRCDHASACQTIPMWMELDDITNRYLASVTLRNLMTGERWSAASFGNSAEGDPDPGRYASQGTALEAAAGIPLDNPAGYDIIPIGIVGKRK